MNCKGGLAALAALVLFPVASRGSAQVNPVVWPKLPAVASGSAVFVPRGWRLERSLKADFNRDGRPDLLMVLRMNDPWNVLAGPPGGALGSWPLNTNPRLLVGAFAQAGGYRMAFQSRVIPRHTQATMDDPLADLKGRPGGFALTLTEFYSAGSWNATNIVYTVRFQNGCFRVIGYDRHEVARNSGDTNDLSINFLTGKVQQQWGKIALDKTQQRWTSYPGKRLVCIEAVENGLDFLRDFSP